jgi:hypothetical protein
LNNTIHGDFHTSATFEQQVTPAMNTSLGQAVKAVLGMWAITFSAGIQEGKARWQACRGKPDTGSNGNWIKREIVERSGLETLIQDFKGTPMIMEDASDHKHMADKIITLTWYRNDESISRMTDFFVIDTGPFEMLLGKEFIDDDFRRHFPEAFARQNLEEIYDEEEPNTLLQARLRPMTAGNSQVLL